jgi:sulfur relay (sulfurtransferase) complex TusBCD TusD component (DsrE family)
MSTYLLIESRDPFDSNDTRHAAELALQLARSGHEVEVFLVQNGVLPARAGSRHDDLRQLLAARVGVLADEFSLRERGIGAAALVAGVRPAPIAHVIDRMAGGWKTIWH